MSSRKWTKAELAVLRKMARAGRNDHEIAAALGDRSPGGVSQTRRRYGIQAGHYSQGFDKYSRAAHDILIGARHAPLTAAQVTAALIRRGVLEPEVVARKPGMIGSRLSAAMSRSTPAWRTLKRTMVNGKWVYWIGADDG